MTRRTGLQALAAIFVGAFGGQLDAQDTASVTITEWEKPRAWRIGLDQVASITVALGAESVTISPRELMDALKSEPPRKDHDA